MLQVCTVLVFYYYLLGTNRLYCKEHKVISSKPPKPMNTEYRILFCIHINIHSPLHTATRHAHGQPLCTGSDTWQHVSYLSWRVSVILIYNVKRISKSSRFYNSRVPSQLYQRPWRWQRVMCDGTNDQFTVRIAYILCKPQLWK